MEPKELLEEIGLTKVQAKIYLQLLYLKKAKVMDLYRETKISRSNIYHNLDKLKKLGLVKEEKKDKQRFFTPQEPKKLIKLFEAKENLAKNIIDDIGEEENGKVKKPIRIYSRYSKEAHEYWWKLNLKLSNAVGREFSYGKLQEWESSVVKIGTKKVDDYVKKRKERNVSFRTLYAEEYLRRQDYYQNKYKFFSDETYYLVRNFDKVRVIPKNVVPIGITAIDNRVGFFGTPDDAYLAIVYSKSLSNFFTNMCDYVWDRSKDYKPSKN